MGKVAEAATDLNLGGQVRSAVERIGGVLEEEWSTVQRQKREADAARIAATTCPYCGTLYPSDDATECPKCNAPRVK
jgi:rubrerythrin